MEKQKNIPALRFSEFSGEWVSASLKTVADFRNGKAHELKWPPSVGHKIHSLGVLFLKNM